MKTATNQEMLNRAATLIHRSDAIAISLPDLHDALERRLGAQVGSEKDLEQALRQCSRRFVVAEPRPLPWNGAGLDPKSRLQLRETLRAAGAEPPPHVLLDPAASMSEVPGRRPTLVDVLAEGIAALWKARTWRPRHSDELMEATRAANRLYPILQEHCPPAPAPSKVPVPEPVAKQRTTIHPRHPRD